MKLAFCIEYPIDEFGGTEVLVSELIRGLAGQHQIVLVSPDDAATVAKSRVAGCVQEHIQWLPETRPTVAGARRLAEQLAAARPDLAHFHLGGTFAWGNRWPYRSPMVHLRQRGIPCLTTVHLVSDLFHGYCGPQQPAWFRLLLFLPTWFGKLHQLRQVEKEIAVSQHDHRKLSARYWPLRERFLQIYHSRLRPEDVALPAGPREKVILNTGHLARRKGQLVLVEAFCRLAATHPEWSLQLAGQDGGDGTAEQIRQRVAAKGLTGRVHLLGRRSDALELMRRAAIYVQPSFTEALGLALQEAMACGCPCVGSRAGGIPELIQAGRTGLLVEPGDVGQLTAALEQLIRDPARREAWGQAGNESIRARGMTSEAMVRRHLELYQSIVRPNRELPPSNPPVSSRS